MDKLKTSSQAFDELFVICEADNSTKLSARVKIACLDAQAEFERLATLVNAYEIVYGAEAYTFLSVKINQAVGYARHRQPVGDYVQRTAKLR